jgi:hypothetical protein
MDYKFSTPPILERLTSVEHDFGMLSAKSYVRFLKARLHSLELHLHIHFLMVFHVTATEASGETFSCWLIGGNAPHLNFSDKEISTPIEAIALYAYYSTYWCAAKGVTDDEGNLPEYRVAPNWEMLDYWDKEAIYDFNAMTMYIGTNLVYQNSEFVLHPDIRDKCVRRGWIAHPATGKEQ